MSDFGDGTSKLYSETLSLERLRLGKTSGLDPHVLDSARLDRAWFERAAYDDMYEFRRMFSVAGQTEVKILRYPDDWWQALKERWFPAWALKRWPVVMRVVEFHATRVFTQVPPPVADTLLYHVAQTERVEALR